MGLQYGSLSMAPEPQQESQQASHMAPKPSAAGRVWNVYAASGGLLQKVVNKHPSSLLKGLTVASRTQSGHRDLAGEISWKRGPNCLLWPFVIGSPRSEPVRGGV